MDFDAGLTQKITEGLNVGIDGFYKSSHSVLDEGQFGEALILSSFNYKRGEIYGGEFTANYNSGGFSAYLNAAYEWARGTNISSAQFLFDPDEFAYIKKNWVFLIMISASPVPPVFPTRGTTGKGESMDFMATGYAGVLQTPKRTIPMRRLTYTCSAGSRSQRRLRSRSVSMSSIFSTLSTNCATVAASESERRNLASAVGFMALSRTIFEVARSLSRL